MMLPNQINTQRFTATGKGGYRASEVDAFIQKVFQNYNKLYNDNSVLRERLSSITPLIDEYNENKKAIADALIWAQTTSDKTITEAKNEGEKILEQAKAEAERMISEKKAEAEAVYAEKLSFAKSELDKAEKELERVKNETKALSDKYISEINLKAEEIIDDANANASKIVADAYNDAQTAREKADSIIVSAKSELDIIKSEAEKLKNEIEKVAASVITAVSAIEIGDIEQYCSDNNEKIQAKTISKDEIEKFNPDYSAVDTVASVGEYEATENNDSFEVETVVDDSIKDIPAFKNEADLISGSNNTEMPDVNAYITKIFETAGNEDSDFSSFSDDLNEMFLQSMEESNISFEELQKNIDKDVTAVE